MRCGCPDCHDRAGVNLRRGSWLLYDWLCKRAETLEDGRLHAVVSPGDLAHSGVARTQIADVLAYLDKTGNISYYTSPSRYLIVYAVPQPSWLYGECEMTPALRPANGVQWEDIAPRVRTLAGAYFDGTPTELAERLGVEYPVTWLSRLLREQMYALWREGIVVRFGRTGGRRRIQVFYEHTQEKRA